MEPVAEVNWEFLLRIIETYKQTGYSYVEVPWLVSKEAIAMTFSGHANQIFQELYPVGSGEQSFLQLEIDGKLPNGKYITMTPCFREENVHNQFTYPHFMKAELYVTTEHLHEDSDLYLAKVCMEKMKSLIPYGSNRIHFEVIKTDEGYDVMYNNVEVGSYGFREVDGHRWLYGTALAEPRFSQVWKKSLSPR